MIKFTNKKVIDCSDWDDLVTETYKRPYCFQQQDGCQSRGNVNITIPEEKYEDQYENETVPEIVNGDEMGVKFEAWLARNPEQKLSNKDDQNDWSLGLWWDRNFYPDIQMVANDLYKKGLIEKGDYVINIDW